jgi:hypothetical protein
MTSVSEKRRLNSARATTHREFALPPDNRLSYAHHSALCGHRRHQGHTRTWLRLKEPLVTSAAHASARRAASAVGRPQHRRSPRSPCGRRDASVALVSSGAVDRRVTERRGRTRLAFGPHGGLRERRKTPRLCFRRSPSCPVLKVMRSPRLPSGMAQSVQVFGRRNAKTIHALMRPASEKRQGTKSRWVRHRRCRKLYGDFAASSGSKGMRPSGRGDGFAPRRRCACRAERSDRRFLDQNGAAVAGQSDGSTQAGALPVESRREWVLLRWRIVSDGIVRYRS